MKILPIQNFKIQNISNYRKIGFRGTSSPNEDTFERSSDNIFSPENLRKVLSNPDNEIGHGAHNIVYAIPGNEEYVLRINKRFFHPNIQEAQYIDTDKHLDINIGQEVGYIRTNGPIKGMIQNIEVLKKQQGISYAVPTPRAISDPDGNLLPNEAPYEDISRKISFKTLLDKLSKMDIKAYEKLLDTLMKAEEYGYCFDPFNSTNIIITDDEINMIDFEKSKITCSLIDLLYSLTNFEYIRNYYMDPYIDESLKHEAWEETITIISKFIKAMQNKGLKFNHEYLRSINSLQILKSNEFKQAIGYNPDDNLTVYQTLAKIGLFDLPST